MKTIIQKWVQVLSRYHLLILILSLATVFLTWPQMSQLFKHLSTDPADLLPPDNPSVQALFEIRDKIETKRLLVVVMESDDVQATLKAQGDLQKQVQQHPLVGEARLKKPAYDFFKKNKFLYVSLEDLKEIHQRIDRKIQREKLGGLYISFEDEEEKKDFSLEDIEEKYRKKYGGEGSQSEYYVSPDGKSYGLYIESKKGDLNLKEEKEFQDELKKIITNFDYQKYHPSMKLYFSGSSRVMEYRALLRDLKVAGMISGILIFLPLLIRFRRIHWVLLIFIPLLLGIPAGITLASLWVKQLNVTTSFLFAILGGLGIESGIHLFSRYYEKRQEGLSLLEAWEDTFINLGPAIVIAVSALTITFLVMIFVDFRGFSEFGFISAIGLWTVLFFYLSFFPALLIFAERIRLLKFKTQIQEKEFSIKIKRPWVRVGLIVMSVWTLASVAIIVLQKVDFEYDTKKIRADIAEEKLAKEKQRSTSGGRVNYPAAVIVKDKKEAHLLEKAIRDKISKNKNSVTEEVRSIYSLVPDQQTEKMQQIDAIRDLLEDDTIELVKAEKRHEIDELKAELKTVQTFSLKDIPDEILKNFEGKKETPGSLLLIFAKPEIELDNGLNAISFAEEIGELKVRGKTYHPSSSSIVFANVLKALFKDSQTILWSAFLGVMLFVYVDFRNFKKTFLVMFSILSGVVWVMGLMYLFDLKLNMYNMVIIPAIMGMSIDNSIHIYHRYEELGAGSISQVLSSTGLASLLASLTNASGFIGLMFCQHGGLRSMGTLAALGVLTCLVSTLIFLPMILFFLEKPEEV